MSFTGLGLGTSPSSTGSAEESKTALIEEKLRLQNILKGASGWFLWVAGLSMLNSILNLSGVHFQFIFGLGITQLVDFLASRAGGAGFVLDLIINGCVAAVFVVFWNFARKGHKWAFIVGMALYALDGLLMLLFKALLGVAFHAVALFSMYGGARALGQLKILEQDLASAGVRLSPPSR